MTSRDEILRTIRRQLPQSSPLPDLSGDWIRYERPVEQFGMVLSAVGGTLHCVRSLSDIPPLLADLIEPGHRVISGIDQLFGPAFPYDSIADPHDLEDVFLAVLPGELAVAENAAVWVQTSSLIQRTLYFIAQHLALVVPASHVVNNLHEAYERISPRSARFGCFISGPSKTADIEQALVKGAHGARTLNVFLVEEM
jgi:L-lactate dehydrogenase complex protein LldG